MKSIGRTSLLALLFLATALLPFGASSSQAVRNPSQRSRVNDNPGRRIGEQQKQEEKDARKLKRHGSKNSGSSSDGSSSSPGGSGSGSSSTGTGATTAATTESAVSTVRSKDRGFAGTAASILVASVGGLVCLLFLVSAIAVVSYRVYKSRNTMGGGASGNNTDGVSCDYNDDNNNKAEHLVKASLEL